MNTGIWIVRSQAFAAARFLAEAIGAEVLGALPDGGEKSGAMGGFQSVFYSKSRWILLMATGIATRYLAGMPANKKTDPAVVVLDEAMRFAIPILGGHEAGANALAYEVARFCGATPVITTATESLKPLTLGVGCRKGVPLETIRGAVNRALEGTPYSVQHIREAATVDIKASEPGLLAWLHESAIPLRIFTRPQLSDRPLTASPSPWVRKQLGIAGVCEPCALLASPRGKLLVPKQSLHGVSLAVVEDRASAEYT
jgi:cobalt-precorrin 5A hydrolase